MERGRMLKIFNTLTGRKDPFEPLVPGQVRMYVCGVTVYDDVHLGHARSTLVFDVIRNYLRFSGYAVKYVRNFTDIDDKIINRASEEGKTSAEIVEKYLLAYQEDMRRLGVVQADVEPKATEHIPDIITMIQTLIAKGHAYRLNGDVYYEVKTYPAYGRLSKRKAEDLLAGARVEVDERKRNPMDFALWKSSKPGEPAWPSPWGPGRPGWHIECSAMSMKHLGDTFDIHGGGQDLIFPHHENEIAQSCAATGKEFVRYWVHNGFVQINQEKMSKSLGNFFTIKEIFEKFPSSEPVTAEVIRYFLLSSHYRSPLDFSDQALQEAKRTLDGFYDLFLRLEESPRSQNGWDFPLTFERLAKSDDLGKSNFAEILKRAEKLTAEEFVPRAIAEKTFQAFFRVVMDDDFDTPSAMALFQALRRVVNQLLSVKDLSRRSRDEIRKAFLSLGQVLGLFQVPVKDWQFGPPIIVPVVMKPVGTTWVVPTITDEWINERIAQRNEARRNKDFAKADEIRKALADKGIILEDKPDGTTRWKR
jgi:cysteinyl-tRNA synthetase